MRSTLHLPNLASVAIAVALVGPILLLGYRGWSSSWSVVMPPFISEPKGAEFVYSEMLGDLTVLWAAKADDPKSRVSLGSVNHQQGYGIKGSVSPDGQKIAYTALPSGRADPSSMATLWVLHRAQGQQRMLLDGIDLRGAPIWSPDSSMLLVKSTRPGIEGSALHRILLVQLESGTSKEIVSSQEELGLYLIGWAPDAAKIYYASLTEKGAFVNSFDTVLQTQTALFQASSGIARDFRLSPDGAFISYSAVVPQVSGVALRLMKANVDGTDFLDIGAKDNDSFGPAWRPDGQGLTFSANGRLLDHDESGSGIRALMPDPQEGLLVPISWSPKARYLAARHLKGVYPTGILGESLVVIETDDGSLHEVETKGYSEFIGWLP